MPKQQHHKEDEQFYFKGANFDDDASILASQEKGFYVDAKNMRPTGLGSHATGQEKIKGETILYPNADNRCIVGNGTPITGNYECIGSVTVNNHIVEIWADRDKAELPFVRIDGWVVLYPKLLSKFPISVDFPPQIHQNDSCVGGEICVTDFNIAPFVLNVEDMLKNSGIDPETNERDTVKFPCTQKYFDDFDIVKYQTQLNRPLDHPMFIELVFQGSSPNSIGRIEQNGSGGLRTGSYQYSMRFLNAAGDLTLFSENTPLIPVPFARSSALGTFPGIKTYGTSQTTSPFGIHIRFRVANLLDFDTIEVKRTAWVNGAALGTPGLEEVIAKVIITPGEFSIVDFYDHGNSFLFPATPEEVVDTLSSIEAAKAIRYYNSRLFLMNIKYASRDTTGKILFDQIGGKEMVPFTFQMGKLGYEDIWNDVYKKSHMRGEKFGYASVFFDDNGARTFALDIPAHTNIKMPERRDPMNIDSLKLSVTPTSNSAYELAQDATITNVSRTFEVFDMVDAITKSQHYAPGGGVGNADPPNILNILEAGSKDGEQGEDNYRVFHPTKDSDTDVQELDLIICPQVKIDGTATFVPWNPKGFAPNYYALGMALAGINQMPPWVKAFSIVRTAPAGRVIAQGQSFYNMVNDAINQDIEKNTDRVWWESPDTYSGLVNFSTRIQPNLASLQLQAVSAVGFFTEVYNGYHKNLTTNVSDGIDMVNYCRILRDDGEINIDISGTGAIATVGILGPPANRHYVAFESWRNDTAPSLLSPNEIRSFGASPGMKPYGLGFPHRGFPNTPFEIDFASAIYSKQGTNGDIHYIDQNVRDWHEPAYVLNIIDPNASVPQTSGSKEYFETGSYVKVESIIGVSDGINQSYYLVDERWQDCIPALRNWHPTSQEDRYVFINDGSGNEQVWLNVGFKTPAQVTAIKTAIASPQGYYVSTQPDGNTFNVKGIYSHAGDTAGYGSVSGGDRLFRIEFNQTDANGVPFIPAKGSFIHVRYNHNAPVEVFGGDSYIGNFNYCPVDAKYNASANPEGGNNGPNNVYMDRPFPYHEFNIDENVFIIRDAQGVNKIQDNNKIKFIDIATLFNGKLRQQIVNGIVESRINTSLDFGARFPEMNYIMRPYSWDVNNPTDKIFSAYFSEYPGEENQFGWGGFRFLPLMNVDYSEIAGNLKHFNKPVGFKETTHFCSRATWSRKRPINKMGAPGLLTFPALQVFDLGDETGEIKFAYDNMSGRYGDNLYAITEHGMALLVTEKSILTELSGAQLASIAPSNTTVIQQALWLSKEIGMNDEFWRSKAEWNNMLYFSNRVSSYRFAENTIMDVGAVKYYTKVKSILDKVEKNYITDVKAVYDVRHHEYWMAQSKRVKKIGNQYSYLQPYVYLLDAIVPGPTPPPANLSFSISANTIISVVNDTVTDVDLSYLQPANDTPLYVCNNQTLPVTIHYDPLFQYESPAFNPPNPPVVLVIIQPGECYKLEITFPPQNWQATKTSLNLSNLPAWSEKTKETWIGELGFEFDKYTTVDDRMFGSRNVETWELDSGLNMNGKPVEGWTLQATCGGAENMSDDKEFFRFKTGGLKPTKVNFYDNIEQFNQGSVQASLDSSVNPQFYLKQYGGNFEQYIPRRTAPPRNRMQSTKMLFQMVHDAAGEFRIPYTKIEFKNIV